MNCDVLDLFAGAGGWDHGLIRLGYKPMGIERETNVLNTARANGLDRHPADMNTANPLHWEAKGLVASPPCQAFSVAGNGHGRDEMENLVTAAKAYHAGVLDWDGALHYVKVRSNDWRTHLALMPLHWALRTPGVEWTCWEQVPSLLWLWEVCARILTERGWHAWAGLVNAEQYGVPQSRKRAVLMASQKPLAPLTPTHSTYHLRHPERVDEGVLPWVSMAEAIGVDRNAELRSNYGVGSTTERGVRYGWQAANTITGKSSRSRWIDGEPLSMEQASVLQTFPADYQWCGDARQRWEQLGNAIPPVMAEAIVRCVG
jgi:DNA (cytosine-5)-methyltransferase 1